ncbi:hypothetical protein BDP55DRAFT_635827 [Colletotrichum godetiae]|uniref:Uncharacterized protein n=1 Tax=Colletotrichum godetiae TaxID=1209918 RepID=A0AAJ0AFI4_9PEZI|nr:uncharacterized protein BDP55DRAFT_635827 [Colletotrichum godetiae]KAK1671387.1 hypothetical protein BDP55DRAFT_635827 [Colletotrichum godetiae]
MNSQRPSKNRNYFYSSCCLLADLLGLPKAENPRETLVSSHGDLGRVTPTPPHHRQGCRRIEDVEADQSPAARTRLYASPKLQKLARYLASANTYMEFGRGCGHRGYESLSVLRYFKLTSPKATYFGKLAVRKGFLARRIMGLVSISSHAGSCWSIM